MYYYGARYYDPELGRFISPDIVLDGLNRYTYCGNNPIKYNDPTGLEGEDAGNGYGYPATQFVNGLVDAYAGIAGPGNSRTYSVDGRIVVHYHDDANNSECWYWEDQYSSGNSEIDKFVRGLRNAINEYNSGLRKGPDDWKKYDRNERITLLIRNIKMFSNTKWGWDNPAAIDSIWGKFDEGKINCDDEAFQWCVDNNALGAFFVDTGEIYLSFEALTDISLCMETLGHEITHYLDYANGNFYHYSFFGLIKRVNLSAEYRAWFVSDTIAIQNNDPHWEGKGYLTFMGYYDFLTANYYSTPIDRLNNYNDIIWLTY